MELHSGPYTLEGYSRSTIETYVRVNELNICFDIGKCPMALVNVPQVFISHFHGDHSLGLTYYIAHRSLAKLPPGEIYIPSSALEDTHALIKAHAAIERAHRDYHLIPVEPGMELPFKRNHRMRMFATDHRIPSVGYTVIEERNKLKAEFQGLGQQEIVALKKSGVEITETHLLPRISYVGDSTVKVFDWHPEIFKSEVLLTECTFLSDEHLEEASKRKHMHLKEIIPYLDDIESPHIVLMHFSMRYTRREIYGYVDKLVPAKHRERILVLA